jgi:hypothetical protein
MLLVAAISGLVVSPKAKAALTMTVTELGVPGAQVYTVDDATSPGVASYTGPVGSDFYVSADIGTSNQSVGDGQQATLEITSIDISSYLPANTFRTVQITLTSTGFTFPATPGTTLQLGSGVTGSFTPPVAGDGVVFQSTEFSPTFGNTSTGVQSDPVTTADVNSTGALFTFSDNATPVSFVQDTTYGLESVTDITLGGSFKDTDVSGTTTVTSVPNTIVPEPTLGMLAAVPFVLGLRRRSRIAPSAV